MTEKQKEIIIKSLSWFIALFILIFIGINNVFGATISDYATKYYYYSANDNSSTNSTVYRSGDSNFITLFGAEPPTYDNGEGFNGFYNRINYSIVKGNIYTLNLVLSYSNLQDSEFSRNDVNNRLLNTNFAHCSDCSISSVSGFLRRYNASAPAGSNLYDFTVSISYTFVATSTTNQFYIGSYTGDDRVLGVDNHLYTSIVSVTGLTIEENNSSTIINQNDTIINQNNQIIEQNNQNTQDIINNQNANNENIINNNNTNTESILNNQNSNTQDIIDNANSNTNTVIENNMVCNYYDSKSIKEKGAIIDSNGSIDKNNSYFGVSDYIKISSKSDIIPIITSSASYYFCFYDYNKNVISCSLNTTLVVNTKLTIPNNASYFKFTVNLSNDRPSFKICNAGNQALNDSIEEQTKTSKGILGKIGDLFDNLFSNDDADISGLDNMVGWLPPGPVDSIINLPLSLFNSLTNTLSGTCTPVTLTLPFVNQNLTLPCFDAYMSQYVTGFNTLWTWVGVTVSVFILYRYLLNLYKWIDDTLTMRENNLPGYYDDNMWGGA